ncbi:hypothetical protein GCM10020000_19470 [Streptomyces olivoverticillatus]
MLAARYGFSVSVDTRSPYGGVRAVVFLPSSLLTQLEIDGPGTTPLTGHPRGTAKGPRTSARTHTPRPAERIHPPQPPEHPAAHPGPDAPATPGAGTVVGSTSGGLPKRRRRQPGAAHPRPAAPLPAETPTERTAEENARRMGAFARGTRAGRVGHHPPPDGRIPGPPARTGPRPSPRPRPPAEDEGNPHA